MPFGLPRIQRIKMQVENNAVAVMFIGVADGCGTNKTTALLATTVAVAVPITPFASRYVTVTGMEIFIVTLA